VKHDTKMNFKRAGNN